MLGAGDQLVLGVQDDFLSGWVDSHGPLHYQAHAEANPGHRRSPEPFGDHLSGSVDNGGFDRPPPRAWIDPDVLDDPGDPASLALFGGCNRCCSRDGCSPRSEILRPDVFGCPGKPREEASAISHKGEVWQYRRANRVSLRSREKCT